MSLLVDILSLMLSKTELHQSLSEQIQRTKKKKIKFISFKKKKRKENDGSRLITV